MSNLSILVALTVACYSSALLLQISRALSSQVRFFKHYNPANLLGLGLHSCVLYQLIDINNTQNLAFFNLFSLVAWCVLLVITIVSIRRAMANLIMVALPIAAISCILPLVFPQTYWIDTGAHPSMLLHILLSTITFSVLCIAALQAVLLGLQEWLLRQHQANRFIQALPPLEILENLLFQLITVGFVLLSILLLSSLTIFDPLFAAHWQKLVLSLFAWLVFACLLIGRWRFGLRGTIAIRSTIIGVTLIMLVYFGSVLL